MNFPRDISFLKPSSTSRGLDIINTCQTCKKQFKARKKTQKYCSQKCYWGERIELICKMCGNNFLINKYRSINQNPQYCSIKCYSIAQKGKEPEFIKQGKLYNRTGIPRTYEERLKIRNGNLKGGYIGSQGYRVLTFFGKQVYEHEYIWRSHNSFVPIPKSWIIHHRNGNRLDNRIENLALLPNDLHIKWHNQIRRGEL